MTNKLPVCPYGAKCYRKNPAHFKEYYHGGGDHLTAAVHEVVVFEPAPHHLGEPAVVTKLPSPTKAIPLSPRVGKRPREDAVSSSISATAWSTILDSSASAVPPLLLGLSTPEASLQDVYGMAFPVEEMKLLLRVAKSINTENPLVAFRGWKLVGPFEVMLGLTFETDDDKWLHYRFRYDTPEMQTVAVSTSDPSKSNASVDVASCARLCWYRNDPKEKPSMVVFASSPGSNSFEIACEKLPRALMEHMKGSSFDAVAGGLQKEFADDMGKDKASTIKHRRQHNNTVAFGTINGLGVSVPYDKKTEVGYRPMMMATKHFQALVAAWNKGNITQKQLDELTEQFQWADIANDECDFGLNLEIGHNLLALVVMRNDVLWHTWRILETAYSLLNRDLFRYILQRHLKTLAGERNVRVASMSV